MKWIKINKNTMVEQSYHYKDILAKDVKIPEGCRLMTFSEWCEIINNHKDKFIDFDSELLQNPLTKDLIKYPYCVGWLYDFNLNSLFGASSGIVVNIDRLRGVRFAKDIKQVKK